MKSYFKRVSIDAIALLLILAAPLILVGAFLLAGVIAVAVWMAMSCVATYGVIKSILGIK